MEENLYRALVGQMTASEAFVAWIKTVLVVAVPVVLLLVILISVIAFSGKSSREKRD